MFITETRNRNEIVLALSGRVDVKTSVQLQNEIISGLERAEVVVLDMKKCDYVSSAGLRAILAGHKLAMKKNGQMKLRNVPELLMSVLNMSGFAKFLTIE